MKKIFLAVAVLAISTMSFAAPNISLKEITSGEYSAEQIYGVRPLNDGETYSMISNDGKQIVRYSYRDGSKIGVVFDANSAKGEKVSRIDGYVMSPNESVILIQTNTKSIYRHSFTADYYIFDVKNNSLVALSKGGAQQVPTFSPDGNQIAFVRKNNIFLVKLLFNNSEIQVTKDGKFNEVLNGIPDWVNEEEFSNNCSLCFSADGSMLVWLKYDETKVPVFSFPMYKGMSPEISENDNYPGAYSYKYPVAGETNAKITMHSYDIKSHAVRTMDLPMDSDGYVPRIYATSNPSDIAVVTLNRHQDLMNIYMANPRSTVCKLVLREEAKKYLRETAYAQLKFTDKHFVLLSDRDGYNHLYLYTLGGQLVKQLTKGQWEVTDFYGYDEASGKAYYASCEESPLRTSVYSVDVKGKKQKLTKDTGWNDAKFSKNFRYFMNVHSDIQTPPNTNLCDNGGKVLKSLVSNDKLKQKLASKNLAKTDFFTFKTSEGVELNGWMVLPADFDANKKYPVIMYQYSGPGSNQVKDSWSSGFMGGTLYEKYMAQEGFIFVCVDGRGTGMRGADFEKCTYLRLGDLESKDQVEAAIYLGGLPFVDKDHIAIWGWSFGGFNTLMSMSEGRPVFCSGVAVAAPSNWKFYDTVYTERYMRTPKENAQGYAINPIERAKNLNGELLLVHGLADDNVHYRNAAEYSEALVQADKQFEMQVYTNRNHSIYGGNTRYHLFTRISDFFKRTLK